MSARRKSLGLAMIAALLATSAAPAVAGPRGWGHGGWGQGGYGYGYGQRHYHRHHHHHRRGGDGFGNFLLGAVVAGGIIALASSASKKAKEQDARAGDGDVRPGGDRQRWSEAEKDAANLCADAAEAMSGRQDGGGARVDDIDYVTVEGDDGYRVEGRMDSGKAFACGTARGEVAWVQFSDRMALR